MSQSGWQVSQDNGERGSVRFARSHDVRLAARRITAETGKRPAKKLLFYPPSPPESMKPARIVDVGPAHSAAHASARPGSAGRPGSFARLFVIPHHA